MVVLDAADRILCYGFLTHVAKKNRILSTRMTLSMLLSIGVSHAFKWVADDKWALDHNSSLHVPVEVGLVPFLDSNT